MDRISYKKLDFCLSSLVSSTTNIEDDVMKEGALQNSAQNKNTSQVQKGLGWCFRLR